MTLDTPQPDIFGLKAFGEKNERLIIPGYLLLESDPDWKWFAILYPVDYTSPDDDE